MRIATENDRPAITKHVLSYYLQLIEETPDPEEYMHQIARVHSTFPHLFDADIFAKGHHLIMYDLMANVVATAGLTPGDDGEWKLVSVYVDKQFRGHGLATTFVKELIAVAKKIGAKRITLCTLPNHMPIASKLYMNLGFELTKEVRPTEYAFSKGRRSMVYHFYMLQLE